MNAIRNAAKAIILRDGKLLVTCNAFEGDEWYQLPGGGQHHSEMIVETLVRECREEIGADVRVGQLLWVRDYIAANHEFAESDGDVHQVEFIFDCQVGDDYDARNGTHIDIYQIGVAWLPLTDLHQYALYPHILKRLLTQPQTGMPVVYLGDVN